jgi:hypothetical protein
MATITYPLPGNRVVFICSVTERPVNIPVTAFDWGDRDAEYHAERFLDWLSHTGRDARAMGAEELEDAIEVFRALPTPNDEEAAQ